MSTLSISIVQTHLDWENKFANLHRLGERIRGISEKTEIVILPEMFSTGFSMNPELLAEEMEGPTIQWMKNIAAEKKIILTGSVIIKEKLQDSYHYFNRLVWMLPTGEWGIYNKRHLFAYAGEDEKYTPGDRRFIASVKGWKINLLVCYDLRFPVWSRQQRRPGEGPVQHEFDLLIYVANWPERRIHAWKTLLQARAIENQSYVVGVNRIGEDGNGINYSGDSMIIDPLGEVIHHSNNKEEVFTCHLQKDKLTEVRSQFPFWLDADHFLIEP
ncbi:MAG: nitrilase family protein [Bacteroidetes bacterium]|nr:MAG: nitrilase family protein [Bacteroidota bacterium]